MFIGYQYNDGGRADAGYKGKTGDCLTRAIAITLGLPYKEVYKRVSEMMGSAGYAKSGNAYTSYGKKRRGQRSAKKVQFDVLESFGFRKADLGGGARPTYTEASEEYGDCIVTTTKHFAALKDGMLQDTFDGREYDWPDLGRCERKAMSVWVPPA